MISPTIGRVVWFYPGPGFPGSKLSEQPMDAHVAYVWGDRMVNLMVVDHRGCPWPVASVPLRQEGDPEHTVGHWCEWMPYQVGQAKKHEPAAKPR